MKSIKFFSFFWKLTALISLLFIFSGYAVADTYRVFFKSTDDTTAPPTTTINYKGTFDYTIVTGTSASGITMKLYSCDAGKCTTEIEDITNVAIEFNTDHKDEFYPNTGTAAKEAYYNNSSRIKSIAGGGDIRGRGSYTIEFSKEPNEWSETGNGTDHGDYHIFNINPGTIPIASTFYLMLAGLGSALLLRRKKANPVK